MIISWNCGDPGHGASLMIFIIPPGFITGGATMAVGVLPLWAYYASHAFPLVWQYRFFRNFSLRGVDTISSFELYGLLLIYFAVLCLLVILRFEREKYRRTHIKPVAAPGEMRRIN